MYFEIKKFRGWFDWLSTLILITIYGYNVEKLDRSNVKRWFLSENFYYRNTEATDLI